MIAVPVLDPSIISELQSITINEPEVEDVQYQDQKDFWFVLAPSDRDNVNVTTLVVHNDEWFYLAEDEDGTLHAWQFVSDLYKERNTES